MSIRRTDLIDPDDWVVAAACRGQRDLFFAPDASETRAERIEREKKAKAVCTGCVVRVECLNEAVQTQEKFGIWGGLNERERRAALLKNEGNRSPQDIADPGRLARLPAVVVQGRPMSHPRG